MIYPVILAGGKGTRLWPLSTQECPKQFIKLINYATLFQLTAERFYDKTLFYPITIISSKRYESHVITQLDQIGINNYDLIIEPEGKDTASAIALVTKKILDRDPNAVILTCPSDHYIPTIKTLLLSIRYGLKHVEKNVIIFGIEPTYPETGYGYIELGKYLSHSCYEVLEFTEKPNIDKAKEFIENGNYCWNSGIYLFKGSIMMNCIYQYEPDIYQAVNEDVVNFSQLKSKSIDYAITEKISNLIVVQTPLKWDDIGSWYSLWNIKNKDDDNNVIEYPNLCVTDNIKNCYISTNTNFISNDIDELFVIESDKVILIMHKDYNQKIKEVVNMNLEPDKILIECENIQLLSIKKVIMIGCKNLYVDINNRYILISPIRYY